MNDTAKSIIEHGIADLSTAAGPRATAADAGHSLVARGATTRVPAPISGPPPTQNKLAALEEAFNGLPMRFVRAAREAARLSGSVQEWAAVEAAYDAIVSARE